MSFISDLGTTVIVRSAAQARFYVLVYGTTMPLINMIPYPVIIN